MRWGQAIPLGRGLRSRRNPGVATAAASETMYLSRVSPWRKVGAGLGAVSVSECKRLVCMCAEGWSLATQRLGSLSVPG